MTQSWREPKRCAECAEFHVGRGTMHGDLPRPGWCEQWRGPVRPEAPACPAFVERAEHVGEIKLVRRYPNSRLEDITDAYLRGYTAGVAENAKLRELVRDMFSCIGALCSIVENSPGCSMCPTNQDEEKPCAHADVYCRMHELGVDA